MADTKISALPASTTPLAGTEVVPLVQGGVTKQVSVANLTTGRAVSGTTFTGTNTIGFQMTAAADQDVRFALPGVIDWRIRGNYASANLDFVAVGYGTPLTLRYGGDVAINTGNLVQGTAAKGVNFTANTPAAGMTSQLLNWYEEGTWTPVYKSSGGAFTTMTMDVLAARYTRIGRQVTVTCAIRTDNVDATGASGVVYIDGLPFTAASGNAGTSAASASQVFGFNTNNPNGGFVQTNTTFIYLEYRTTANGAATELPVAALTTGAVANQNNLVLTATYTI